ncbi:hypothetical protein Ahy_A02g006746 [Arachis hypogaea]|uniref:Replication factor A C-terminal domain-containing protein n=1 Tax=Arachis hypogaea TaxID=3818 RepID=A0A445EBA3_ARAHY|nr:hypothetical protein Ahy_A02g006746 [Arachis hypogaea]
MTHIEGPIWILGTIVSINAKKDDWFYKSCKRYECDKCGHTHGTATLRYKLEVTVHDGTGSMSLLLWNRETTQLCGKSVDKIIYDNGVGEDNLQLLDNMMDKQVLFKLNVKSGNIKQYDPVYTVIN